MTKRITIEGMSCEHCVKHVKEALTEIGANNVNVSLEKKIATAEMGNNVSDEKIKFAIEDSGYDVIGIENV